MLVAATSASAVFQRAVQLVCQWVSTDQSRGGLGTATSTRGIYEKVVPVGLRSNKGLS